MPAVADASPRTALPLAKLRRPLLRAGLLPRPRLEAQIVDALQAGGVALLSAPGGWGKTVALVRALAALPESTAVAWVSIDEDDDLPRLLACLVAALDRFDPPWRVDPDAMIALAGQPGTLRQVANALLDTVAAADAARGVVVLDDLHRLQDPAAFELIAMLVERLPPSWTLVFATRVDPPLPLARLRVRGELSEWRQPALAFSPAEVEALRAMLDPTGRALADELLDRTGGWPAGLRLCLSSSSPRGGLGVDVQRHLFDYLASEIFATLPAALRRFLLKVSVLPELRASRCAVVADEPRAAWFLEEIERRGLFASVLDTDDDALTLKLHDLFREFLEDRLRREHAAEWPLLLQRAAAAETDPLRRIVYLLRAADWAEAERALLDAAPALLGSGGGAQALRLIEQFPAAWRAGSGRLPLVHGMVAWLRFEWRTLQADMQRAAERFEAAGERELEVLSGALGAIAAVALGRIDDGQRRLATLGPVPDKLALRAQVQVAHYWASGAAGPADAPARHLRALIDTLAQGAPAALWYRCAPHFMLIGRPGLAAAFASYASMARAVAGDGHAALRVVANIVDAWRLLWSGDFAAAGDRLAQASNDDRWLGQPRNLRVPILGFRCLWHALRGELPAFRAAAGEVLADVDGDPQRRGTWRGVYLCMLARMALGCNDRETAFRLRDELAATPSADEWPYMRHARAVIHAQFALADGHVAEALVALGPAVDQSRDIDSFGLHVSTRLVMAQALLRRGDRPQAAAVVAPLAEEAEADVFGSAVFGGVGVLAPLATADWGGTLPDAALHRLRRWHARAVAFCGNVAPAAASGDDVAATPPSTPPTAPPGRLDRLSEREAEVLERIAAGDSNKLIARRLELSPHTVKRHVANILDKLGVASRGQAAACHRRLPPTAVHTTR